MTVGNVIELAQTEGPQTVTFDENDWSRVEMFTASSSQDRDGITWTLDGDDAFHFSIAEPSGALRFDLDAVSPAIFKKPPDYELPVDIGDDNVYELTLLPSSPTDTAAAALGVTVTVSDADEPGTVALSTKRPRIAVAVSTTLSDPDTVVDTSRAWVWERTTGYDTWAAIAGATTASYTPTAADAGSFLRARSPTATTTPTARKPQRPRPRSLRRTSSAA